MIRAPALLLFLALAGCEAGLGPAAVVTGASLMVIGRTLPDAVVSVVAGQDCSIAHVGAGEAYCRPDITPAPQPFCTRSIGSVDCWRAEPPPALPPLVPLADSPPAQPARPWWTRRS